MQLKSSLKELSDMNLRTIQKIKKEIINYYLIMIFPLFNSQDIKLIL